MAPPTNFRGPISPIILFFSFENFHPRFCRNPLSFYNMNFGGCKGPPFQLGPFSQNSSFLRTPIFPPYLEFFLGAEKLGNNPKFCVESSKNSVKSPRFFLFFATKNAEICGKMFYPPSKVSAKGGFAPRSLRSRERENATPPFC